MHTPSELCLSDLPSTASNTHTRTHSKGHVKLSDFGLATELQSSMAMCGTFVGTSRYVTTCVCVYVRVCVGMWVWVC
jgi:serine/threonine protein kinase